MNYLIEVINAKYVDGYKILIDFSDGIKKIVDLKDELCGPVFEPLRDIEKFKNFKVNRTLGTIEWPGQIDLAPDGLYEIGQTIKKVDAA
jgi:hypothetical protein